MEVNVMNKDFNVGMVNHQTWAKYHEEDGLRIVVIIFTLHEKVKVIRNTNQTQILRTKNSEMHTFIMK